MVTILYCIVGLPLTLMFIAKMGHAFATVFRVIYHTCCCAVCCLVCIIRRQNGKNKVVKNSSLDMNDALGALVIGPNDMLHRSTPYTSRHLWGRNIKRQFRRSLRHDTAVPTLLVLLVMAGYIVGGAAFFVLVEEGRWSYYEGAYFCFVTLTTIGFGDYLPGIWRTDGFRTTDLVLCTIYVLFGLALIGMCIDLMQVDGGKKLKWLARKVGLTKPKRTKTPSDTKKEKVGLKLSCEAIPQTVSASGFDRLPMQRSVSHNLEVPSPISIHSISGKRSSSVPNTPSTPIRSFSSRPSRVTLLPTTMDEERTSESGSNQ
ncbi:potassium channel subfamily K member 4-like [Watersipora subatra]|uniref:potassium channel subfamily K member 4-like n=1 Tax=Watersipora subatra TaxID=2589382 RepID=UPI00355C6E35